MHRIRKSTVPLTNWKTTHPKSLNSCTPLNYSDQIRSEELPPHSHSMYNSDYTSYVRTDYNTAT